MICTCAHKSDIVTFQQAERYDPTRTVTARNEFAREMSKRFRRLRGMIREAIVERDVFGLQAYGLPAREAFDFPRDSRKVAAFMEWLRQQQVDQILEVTDIQQVGEGVDRAWTNKYIQRNYETGVKRASTEMRKAGIDVPTMEQRGGVDAVMGGAVHADRVGLLYTRAFEELKGITEAMDQQISRVLSEGMAEGQHPRTVARRINATISGKKMGELGITDTVGRFIPAERRARMMARTEMIRAHHIGMVQEYKNWEIEDVRVRAEWRTAGDRRVCAECAALESRTFTLKEIENMIPYHPECRCVALPKRPQDARLGVQPEIVEMR